MGRRFLVLSASMGSGHDAVAAELSGRLRARGHGCVRVDVLDLLPAGVGGAVRTFYRTVIHHAPAVYAGIYATFFRSGEGPRPGSSPLATLADAPLLDIVGQGAFDVVVPVFHLAAQLTGGLRARGRLGAGSAVVITDFAAHRQWLHPGNDLHLCLTPGIADEVRRAVGRPAAVSGPLVARRFLRPAAHPWATAADGRHRVLIAAGAWGVGTHIARTARWVAGAGYEPVVLCGRNEELRREVERVPGARAVGWTDDMPGLLAGAHALVDNAAGQTALEALAAGVPVIGYRPIPGHGREGVRRMAQEGFTDYARDSWALVRSLDALTAPGPLRARRTAAGRSLFDADPVAPLEELAARHGASPRDERSPA